MSRRRRILGALLVERGLVTPEVVERALELQSSTGEPLGQTLVEMGLLDETELYRTLALQLDLAWADPPLRPDPDTLRRVRPAFARKRRVLPLEAGGRGVRVAMADPLDLSTLDDLQFQCGGRVQPVVSAPSAIDQAIARAYPSREEGASDGRPARKDDARRALERLLEQAATSGASDLHLEPTADGVVARQRVDGILRPVPEPPPVAPAALLSRIKVLGRMDIAVKLRPQDGGFTTTHDEQRFAVRVSTLPVEHGEKAVLRLLSPDATPEGLAELGLAARDLRRIRGILRAGGGVLLTAGPTGSGKTSTLAAAISELDRVGMNVVTLEDPVEHRLPGVSQVQVHPRAGLTFPSALRAVLRQDPDVIMVGEIRDRETAEIAMAAAVTGHLVLSTIHTIDAPSGITRLLHMGVPPHLVAGGLAGIVAQRLVRRICSGCGGRQEGCGDCPDGYRGRTGIFQVLAVSEPIREEIVRGGSTSAFRRRARAGGMGSMADDARRKVAEGITTPHEVARVLRDALGEAFPCRRCRKAMPPEASGCPHCGLPVAVLCRCGERLQGTWRYCPACLRPAPPSPDGR